MSAGPRSRIGIAGGSCSGKSELAAALAARTDGALLSLDDYYLDLGHLAPELRSERNFDHPDALDWELALSHVRDLCRGRAVRAPVYDFTTHARGDGHTFVAPRERVIVEGLFVLHLPEVRELLDLSIFVDGPQQVRLARRLERDTRERGRGARSVREQHSRTVEPMFRRYVLPTRELADLVLDGRRPLAELVEAVAAR